MTNVTQSDVCELIEVINNTLPRKMRGVTVERVVLEVRGRDCMYLIASIRGGGSPDSIVQAVESGNDTGITLTAYVTLEELQAFAAGKSEPDWYFYDEA